MSHRRARTFPRAAKMAAFPVRSGFETSRHASARVLRRRRRGAAALYHKLLEAQRDWENGRKNFHEHTDEEVAQLIAEAEKKSKRKKKRSMPRNLHRK